MLKDWMPRPAGEQNEQKARLKAGMRELENASDPVRRSRSN